MTAFCSDRDILAIEPLAYLAGGFDTAQTLRTGSDGVLASTTFTSATGNFLTAGIAPGMVLTTSANVLPEGSAVEILAVNSATELSVSVLRTSTDDDPVAPTAGTALHYALRTYAARIALVSNEIAETLRRLRETNPIDPTAFAPNDQLRKAAASGVLAGIYLARAQNARPHDANWIKAEYYRLEYRRLLTTLRLAVDADGDGTAEQTRSLGNVQLKRV